MNRYPKLTNVLAEVSKIDLTSLVEVPLSLAPAVQSFWKGSFPVRQIISCRRELCECYCNYGMTILGSNILSPGNTFQSDVTHIMVHLKICVYLVGDGSGLLIPLFFLARFACRFGVAWRLF